MEKKYTITFSRSESASAIFDILREANFKADLNYESAIVTVVSRIDPMDLRKFVEVSFYNSEYPYTFTLKYTSGSEQGFLTMIHLEFVNSIDGSNFFKELAKTHGREVLLNGQFKHVPYNGPGYRFKIIGYPSDLGPISAFNKLIHKFNTENYPIKSITFIYDEN